MRILHISSALRYGPTERHIADVCRGLQRRGHEVFAALRPTNEWQEHLSFLPAGNVFHVSVRNPFGVLSAKKIAAYARKHNIDIVHAHLPRDYFPGSLACNLAKNARFVLTRHSGQPLKPFNRFALKNLSAAIAASKDIERSLSLVFPPHKLSTVAAGVDLEHLSGLDRDVLGRDFREFHSIEKNAFVVAMLGDLTPENGQREFVLAAGEIAKQQPNSHFILIGTNPAATQSFRRDLVRLTEVLGLADRFLFLDHAGDSLGIFSAANVLVPSMDWEYPGREVLEAISLDTAVLFTGSGGSKRFPLIRELSIRSNEPIEVAEAIVRLESDPDRLRSVVKEMKDLIMKEYSFESTVNGIENVYKNLK